MQTATIIVTGPFASGKTTFIQSISEIDVVSTEITPESSLITVAMDAGRYTVDTDLVLYLLGTPGARRFEFAWDINYTRNMLGYVIVVNSCLPDRFREAEAILNVFQKYSPAPYVVAANWQDQANALSADELRQALNQPETVPFVPCVATDTVCVKKVLLALMYESFEKLNNPVRK